MTNPTATTAPTTPVEIDTRLAEIYGILSQIENQMGYCIKTIDGTYRQPPFLVEKAKTDLVGLKARHSELSIEAFTLEGQYRLVRWNRYFLVQNSNGHVHSSTRCNTCFASTSYSWLLELADQPVSDMVEEWGEMACTVCFPEAPTFPRFSQPSKRDAAAKAERASAKAERDAAKAAKTLNAEDVFKDFHDWKVTTVAAAKAELREAAALLAGYGYDHLRPAAPAIRTAARAALLAKGITEADLDTLEAKAVKLATKRGY